MKKLRNINIDSKNILAKQISNVKLPLPEARSLIDSVIQNHSSLWKDNLAQSKPEKGKWVRSAYKTDLGKLLKLIDVKVLSHLDEDLPAFIFGGRKGISNVTAAKHLLGFQKERTLLALDITKFFESVELLKVETFYKSKRCSPKISKILARLSCVPRGSKHTPESTLSLARGFSTSTRLAVWSYMTAFYRIHDLVMKRLKNFDPRIAVFIDDIGISASRVPKDLLVGLVEEIESILNEESSGALRLNKEKTKIMNYKDGVKHLGVVLNRNKLVLPKDMQARRDWLTYQYKVTGLEKYKKPMRGYKSYENVIRKANKPQ
ncbi:MAG: reverse transcriptase domain-containing protein [Patescibacteria group bacterium]